MIGADCVEVAAAAAADCVTLNEKNNRIVKISLFTRLGRGFCIVGFVQNEDVA